MLISTEGPCGEQVSCVEPAWGQEMARLDGISLQRPRGDAEPSRARKLIIKKIVLGGVVLAALPFGGCSDEPTCSSPDALRTLQSIVDENIVDPQTCLQEPR